MNADIRNSLRAKRAEMTAFLDDLVSIPSENPPGNAYPECLARIRRQLDMLDIESEIRGDCLVSRGDADEVLAFHGHYDVVPAQDASQFTPRMQKGTMFGRGTSDMKGGLVAMIYAARALREIGAPAANGVCLAIVPDEETCGGRGSASLLRDALPRHGIIGMLTPEPTSGVIWNANRGAITLAVTITGRPAHVGLQHLGINAFEQMVDVVNRLMVLKRRVEKRSILLLGGTSQAGTNFNVVPALARFTIDRRTNPEEDLETERRALFDVLDAARADGIDLQVTTLQEGISSATPVDGAVARALADSVESVKGERPAFEMCPGLLETRFYAAHGVPAFAYGPGVLAVSHGPKEFVRIAEVLRCAEIYAEAALRVLSKTR